MQVFRISSLLPIEKLQMEIAGEEAIIIRPDRVRSENELELAAHLARKAFDDGRNVAKKLKYEFLLWISGKTDIRRAIADTKPRDAKDVLLVVFSGGRGILKKLQAKEKPLKLEKKAEPLALERISLSRIK